MDEYAKLNLIRLERDDEDADDLLWHVTFSAATGDLDYTEMTVQVTAIDPEGALREGRTALERALKHLKVAADRWQS